MLLETQVGMEQHTPPTPPSPSRSRDLSPTKKALLTAAMSVAIVAATFALLHMDLTASDHPALRDLASAVRGAEAADREGAELAAYLDRHLTEIIATTATQAAERARLRDEVLAVYGQRSYRLAWVGVGPIQRRARSLVTLLDNEGLHGLDATSYRSHKLSAAIKRLELTRHPKKAERLALEVRLTSTLLRFTRDLHGGRVETVDLPVWYHGPAEVDVVTRVSKAMASDGERQMVERLRPRHKAYHRLAARLGDYRALVEAGGWPTVPTGDTLEPGDEIDPEAFDALLGRLVAEGDLAPEQVPSVVGYDVTMSRAVASFQSRYGLTVDGKLGDATRAAMNVPAADRLQQIEANLERWRWLPEHLPADRIEVNVPSFELRGYRAGQVEVEMAVAVGKRDWETPLFEDEVIYAQVNPYWNVPESIAVDEVLPAIRRDATYLERQNMEVLRGWSDGEAVPLADMDWQDPGTYGSDYRFRQRPGASNALGQIKFIFPNRHGVYLHDTPAQRAFERADRAVSHGCVRVSEPLRLANFLLADDALGEVQAALESGEPQRVNLEKPMPVMLHYWTAFVDEDGRMSFRDDLYDVDEGVTGLLEGARLAEARPRPTASNGQTVVTSAP